ncbi:DUF6602 domain-containing protein, partial [Priestia megaterium]|uniref:DUF6602 domain-containing protein n=1 Tax=Priestia megaterium TaxID=1404 RepID=UPI003AAB478F
MSTQCDTVIYDKNSPTFKNSHISFFPVETISSIGEVKSTLDTSGLIELLIGLKKDRRKIAFLEISKLSTNIK